MKQDEETIIDAFIEWGIFKKPKDVDITKEKISTDWFDGLTDKQQKIEMDNAGKMWWKKYGEPQYNNVYSDSMIETDGIKGSIENWWNKILSTEISKDVLDLNKRLKDLYKNRIVACSRVKKKKNKKRLKEEDQKKVSMLTPLMEKEDSEIVKSLQKKRKDGVWDSAWYMIGIPYMIKHGHRDKLLKHELDWYDNEYPDFKKKVNEELFVRIDGELL